MYLRKFLVRLLLSLYPALWRKEYGEEMRSMLLAQPLRASVVGDVFLNAMRENFRRPDPWKIGFLILICWRTIWILWGSISQRSPETWAPFAQVDHGLFLLIAFSTGCWTTINEGKVRRGTVAGFWSAMLADSLAPSAAALLLFALAPNKTIPNWAWDTTHAFESFTRALASVCGALLGYLIRRRFPRSTAARRP